MLLGVAATVKLGSELISANRTPLNERDPSGKWQHSPAAVGSVLEQSHN